MQETQFVYHSEDIERRTKVSVFPFRPRAEKQKVQVPVRTAVDGGKPAPMVVCKVEECRAILNWNGTSMRYHAKLHGSTANGAGESLMIPCSSSLLALLSRSMW
uniref:C2H2-type domain-containing protein n=1 Tax=Ditylenchus dipsaci TaxID=166011 RepID=A0A915EQD3_9BILA